MKYVVTRTGHWTTKPCEGAVQEDVLAARHGNYKTLEESRSSPWFWKEGTLNHRVTEFGTACDSPGKAWVMEIPDIVAFCEEHGRLVIQESNVVGYPYEIEIYDSYRE